ncbi:hypothetical protein ACF3MZ_26780 [Paenibacillaceae bacterium WGS1546]|uniref:hypothetical protein n=1 Tax=Cohnella sp. WGS1546 TaxID=3366810 RepID=UPI00372D273A
MAGLWAMEQVEMVATDGPRDLRKRKKGRGTRPRAGNSACGKEEGGSASGSAQDAGGHGPRNR